MPQPLSKVTPKATVFVGAEYLRKHQKFSNAVASVTAFWAHSDGNLAAILSFMMKTDIRTGVAMYQALMSAEAKLAALYAAADIALEQWEAILLRAVIQANKASRNQRNDFAHGIWGGAAELPDALLWMDPRVVMDKNVSHRQAEMTADGRRVIRPKGLDHSQIMVWRENDFKTAVKSAEDAYGRLVNFYYLVGYKDDRARKALLNDDQVQRVAAKLSRESRPEVQSLLRPPEAGEPAPKGYRIHPAVDLPE